MQLLEVTLLYSEVLQIVPLNHLHLLLEEISTRLLHYIQVLWVVKKTSHIQGVTMLFWLVDMKILHLVCTVSSPEVMTMNRLEPTPL